MNPHHSNDNIVTQIIEFVRDLWKYWYVAAASFVIAGGIAVFYLKYSARTYDVSASVMLTIERSNAFGAKSEDLMRVGELIEKDKNLQNEVFYLQSSPLVRSVFQDMDLHVTYFIQEDGIPKELEFSMKDLYNQSPFIVIPNNQHLQPVDLYFYVYIVNEESCIVSATSDKAMIVDFKDESVVLPSAYFHMSDTYRFGEEISDTYVSFKILLNSNYKSEDYQGKDLFFKINTTDFLVGEFKSSLKVEPSAIDATMVEMVLVSDNRQKGIDFLNGLINKYIEKSLEEKNYLATKTIEHLDFQLTDISESLGTSEDELQNIRRSSSVMNIDEKAGNLYNQLQTSETQKDEIDRRRAYLIQMEEYFSSNRDSSGFLAPSAMGLDDPLLSGLIQELTTLTNERQQIINNNQLRNPRLRTLDISIANLKSVIVENLQYSINTADAELREINSRINSLNREYAGLPFTQRRLLGIERKFNLSENVYMSLLEQRIQAQIIKASTLPDLEVVEPPQYLSVHSPKTLIVLILALFIGALIPSVFVLSRKLFTSRILSKDELRNFTSLTQIGSIPQNNRNIINVIVDQPNSIVAEAFHTVRSNLIYYLMGRVNQTILVTSSMEGEGKSFVALNIASSLAITNNKTLLIEFDLRRPSDLYSKLGIRGLVGVSSYLINKANLDEITIKSEVENLDIILAGQIPPNPIELISSRRSEQLFEELRKSYDYIIIDTPPYGVLTDSFVLMKFADIKIYVARLGYVKKKILLNSFEDIESKNISNVQILLNGDNPKQGSYGKYYTADRKIPIIFNKKSKRKLPAKKAG